MLPIQDCPCPSSQNAREARICNTFRGLLRHSGNRLAQCLGKQRHLFDGDVAADCRQQLLEHDVQHGIAQRAARLTSQEVQNGRHSGSVGEPAEGGDGTHDSSPRNHRPGDRGRGNMSLSRPALWRPPKARQLVLHPCDDDGLMGARLLGAGGYSRHRPPCIIDLTKLHICSQCPPARFTKGSIRRGADSPGRGRVDVEFVSASRRFVNQSFSERNGPATMQDQQGGTDA